MKRSFGVRIALTLVLIVSAFSLLGRIAYAQDCVKRFNQDPRHASLLSGGELRRGAWLQRPGNDMVFVMVHGIFSDNRDAWLNPQSPSCTYWPELIASTDDFEKAGVFLASYYTDVGSKNFDIRQAANTLYTLMTTPVGSELLAPLNLSRIVFVAHSMGGIVVRRMLEKKWASFKGRKIGLVLVASPSLGSGWAKRASDFRRRCAELG